MARHELFSIVNKLTEIGIALSQQKDHVQLMEKILLGAKQLTGADGGTFYAVIEQQFLRYSIVNNDSLAIHAIAKPGEEPIFPDIPLFDAAGEQNLKTVAAYAFHHGATVNIVDVYEETGFDFSGTRAFDEKNHFRTRALLTVPLKNHEDETIAVLQLVNPDEALTGHPYFTFEDQKLVESLASQAAVAMTSYLLVEELHRMFESLTRVIAEAIDEKSPVTGKHCKRVPIIAEMLAEAVNQMETGPLAAVKFSQEELYELRIAALLHDCGKVVTPVHVVEKNRKLQALVDRLELVDARLAVLRAEAKIATLEKKLAGVPSREEWSALEQEEEKKVAELQEIHAFLMQTNLGKEKMPPEMLQKVKSLSQLQWIDYQGQAQPLLTTDEVENLSIVKGNLTEKEREVIQNHVVMTIKMLEQIPYPKSLKNVPEIAGKHHEKLDGNGYPRRLTGKEISLRARILAIADMFEALTAPDRPYKEVLPLSSALAILQKMCDQKEIDKNLWQVFLEQKVYLKYAKQYLTSKQIDVD